MKFRDTRITRFVKGLGAVVGVTALLAVAPVAASASVSPFLESTGSMLTPRQNAAAAPLPGGEVLIVGGFHFLAPKDHSGAALFTAEIYDPASGKFSATGSMERRRMDPAIAPLPGGDVLVAGGINKEGTPWSSAEVYDPETGEFTTTGSMAVPRTRAVAAPLPNGDVLVAGGLSSYVSETEPFDSAEIYDPETGEFSPVANTMTEPRQDAAVVALANGQVLISGGLPSYGGGYTETAELFDPETEEFSATGSMTTAASGVGALLPDGTGLVFSDPFVFETPWSKVLEEYRPATGTFMASSLALPARLNMAAAPLPGGRVLIAGGETEPGVKFEGHTVSPVAEILVSAPSATSPGVDFGEVEVSTPSAVETLTVTNDGAQTLEFEAVATLSGPNAADFTIVADGCATAVLAFGESCTVEVQVEPSALGPRSASVQLPNNSATGLQEFALKAEGV